MDGEKFYRIENYDRMEDFFMTITSSSDIWNFLWSKGGITCGRCDSDHAVFPYYTADKVSDMKTVSGPYTVIAVRDKDGCSQFWEPFADLQRNIPWAGTGMDGTITRNIYKSTNGSKVWFEEVNAAIGLSFRYGWTSSARFGIVRMACLRNESGAAKTLSVLDGARNIMCAATTAAFQNSNSVLLDAYKQADIDAESGLALFSVSSIVSDKAEPNEGLYANSCWFSTGGSPFLLPGTPQAFFAWGGDIGALPQTDVLTGQRPSCYTAFARTLEAGSGFRWYQVFDVGLTAAKAAALQDAISRRGQAVQELEADIESGSRALDAYIESADGVQDTAETMTAVHHRANVLFNIMRGGVFADGGNIRPADFAAFVKARLPDAAEKAALALKDIPADAAVSPSRLKAAVATTGDAQLCRLAREYLPLTFSRRHGDPSRPWNKFSIKLTDSSGKPILRYEGNWRDIFQNWEALSVSYPGSVEAFCAVFLSAMTIEGFNPYRISTEGIDWEVPDPDNPWAQFGYWGDHQVIYLLKLLELWQKTDPASLAEQLDEPRYTTANVPYRLKGYEAILADPHNSIVFDKALSERLIAESAAEGSDKKLVQGSDARPALTSMASKLLQIVIAKAANLVPGGGIWMNTQRPEWNDANNALAGWGLSVVTTAYLYRFLGFLIGLFKDSPVPTFSIPQAQAGCLAALAGQYASAAASAADNAESRAAFVHAAGKIFEAEYTDFYRNGYGDCRTAVPKERIVATLTDIRRVVAQTLSKNRRDDGLYHSYNTLSVCGGGMEVEHLQEMLEGQVAILSSGLLSDAEALSVITALRQSRMYESRQHSYLLYPNKKLPSFLGKNALSAADTAPVRSVIEKTGTRILERDRNGTYHFNAGFVNARVMKEKLRGMPDAQKLDDAELRALEELYEKTFRHKRFTGRSGTFYAYEGLGSIYWHMVSKLLLAVQENAARAYRNGSPHFAELCRAYYDIRSGLSFNKTPELYGAFPSDPYSHTPYQQGAKQPGMTGQVKEEILTRWGELGVCIQDGSACFEPYLLRASEFHADGTLSFSWCGTPVTYHKAGGTEEACITLGYADGRTQRIAGTRLPREESRMLFGRTGAISRIDIALRIKEE